MDALNTDGNRWLRIICSHISKVFILAHVWLMQHDELLFFSIWVSSPGSRMVRVFPCYYLSNQLYITKFPGNEWTRRARSDNNSEAQNVTCKAPVDDHHNPAPALWRVPGSIFIMGRTLLFPAWPTILRALSCLARNFAYSLNFVPALYRHQTIRRLGMNPHLLD